MSCYGAEMTPQSLDRLYDELSKEQMRLMSEFKTDVSSSEIKKDLSTQKQLTLINTIMISVLRLRNLKKVLSNTNV
tara:strand:- start:354 stop:581 length:228 start_codon:yes stop_codon:yes gene_type:complete